MLIILRGPAGVGKTTVSDLLAKKMKWRCIHLSDIFKANGLGCMPGEKYISRGRCIEANDIVRSSLKRDKITIVEDNFYHKEALLDLQTSNESIVFTLKADLATCITRDASRESIGSARVTDVFMLTNAFDAGIIIETAGKTAEQVVDEIISHVM